MPSDGIIRHMPRDNIREGIGESEVYLDFMEAVSRIAGIDRPVIFCGERGSGNENGTGGACRRTGSHISVLPSVSVVRRCVSVVIRSRLDQSAEQRMRAVRA